MTDLTVEYAPRTQFLPFHHRDKRWATLVVHRRGGKTVACVNELLTRATYTPKQDARYAYIAPFYRQAKDVAWQYLKSYGEPVITKIRESELRVELVNGAWITLYGADNPDALRGIYLDGVVLDEYGDCRPSLWGQVVLPTLADRKGWAVFIGTPKGKNHFYEITERARADPQSWFYLSLPASQSHIIDQEELAEMQAQMTDEEYQQEMECDFTAAVKGTYYADIIQQLEKTGQISPTATSYSPTLPVNVATDLGFSDSTAIWFWQQRQDGIAIVDYYENAGKALPHYLQMLLEKGYDYDTIWLPHDAVAKTLQTGRSTIEQVIEFCAEHLPETRVDKLPRLAVQHGIDAARMVLPMCFFDQTACYDGIEALRAYRRRYNEIEKSYSDKPLHDWASHGADAFRYLSLVCKQAMPPTKAEERALALPSNPVGFTLNDLWAHREKQGRKYEKMRI